MCPTLFPAAGTPRNRKHVELILTTVNVVLQVGVYVSIFVYAPLARNATRAVVVPLILALVWVGFRIASIYIRSETSPPLFGLLLVPIAAVAYSAAARALKKLIFRTGLVQRVEQALRSRFSK